MMEANLFYQRGQLHEAISAATAEIKKTPTDINKRDFLRELLCIAEDYERADKQLEIIATQDITASVGVALQRQLIRAAQARQQVFREGRLPEFVNEPTKALQLHLQALLEFRNQNHAKACQLIAQAQAALPLIAGRYNDQCFESLRDLDDLTASLLEVFTSNGKYYWVSLEQIVALEFYEPTSILELTWRRAHLQVANGPEGDVYIPAIYFNDANNREDAMLLGRKTDWLDDESRPVQGIGQRMFLIGDEIMPIMELQNLTIERVVKAP